MPLLSWDHHRLSLGFGPSAGLRSETLGIFVPHDPDKEVARCVLSDDMEELYPLIAEADGYILGTPVNMGAVTAVMKTFLERTCWVFAKPGTRPIDGCPTPRTIREKRAALIVSSGIVPPLLRRWCDDATPLLRTHCDCELNARIVGTMYAGAVERRGVETYFPQARKLGEKLVF